jgi:predicted nucleic acid-binding protein
VICVDSSVAAKWIFREELQEQAERLYEATITARERIVAPPLLPIELTNIIRQRMRRPKPPGRPLLSLAEAREHLERFLAFSIELSLPPDLHRLALDLVEEHALPAVYDAHYLALAQLIGCEFWTADRKLVNVVGGELPFVRWLGDY